MKDGLRKLLVLAMVVGVATCAMLQPLPKPPANQTIISSGAPLSMVGPDGRVVLAIRQRVTARLADLGEDNLLGRHLAAMEASLEAPLVAGNRVRLLVDGPRAYAAMFGAIAAARDHINVETYILDEAQYGGTNVSDLLVKKATSGLAVNVLYDAVGSSETPPEFFAKLKAAGVRICEFNPLNPANRGTMRFTQRDHRKVLVIDGNRAFAGGINFSATYSSGSRQRRVSAADVIKGGWRDTHIELEGPAGLEVQRLFLQSWAKQKCPALKPASYLPPPSDAGDTLLRINASSKDSLRNETYVAALSALTFAKSSIDLTMAYFAPNDHIEAALIAAARRGVRVRLLLAGVSDFAGIVHAGRSHYSRLLAAGVQIFEMHKSLLHAKTLEIDGIWSTVGSANWDSLSFSNNDELNVIVIDQGFAAQMRAMFADDLATATHIGAVSWAKRPIKQRILESFWASWQRIL